MADRLKQIWGGFESVTQRPLTGRGVGNIVVPSRQDFFVDDEAFLSEEFRAPSEAAFAALRAQLSAAAKKAPKRGGANFDPSAPPPLSESSFHGDSEAARDLIRGLKATEARIRRSELDYAASLAPGAKKQRAAKARASIKAQSPKAPRLAIKRKKFLGLF